MAEPRRLVVGRVIRPHGTRGEVVVQPETDVPERRFARGSRLGAGDRSVVVESSRFDRGKWLVRFYDVRDRGAAESLRGLDLSIPAAQATPPPEGAYYPHQLEGLTVLDESGARLGTLARVEFGVANDVWVVDADGREVAVPAVDEFVIAVDPDAGRIVLRPIPGLFDE